MTTTSPTSNQQYTDEELTELTEILNILSTPRRVRTLTALRGESELRRSELVQRVIDETYADERVTAQKRKRINISLYQQHIPALSNPQGNFEPLIEWDRDADIIRPTPRYDDVIAVLDCALMAYRRS